MTAKRAARLLPIGSACFSILVGACSPDDPPPAGPDAAVVSSVQIYPSERTLGMLGVTVQLAAGSFAADGSVVYGLRTSPERFSWTSSDPDVATVDDRGLITSVGEGKATITATVEGVTGSIPVTVWDRARHAW